MWKKTSGAEEVSPRPPKSSMRWWRRLSAAWSVAKVRAAPTTQCATRGGGRLGQSAFPAVKSGGGVLGQSHILVSFADAQPAQCSCGKFALSWRGEGRSLFAGSQRMYWSAPGRDLMARLIVPASPPSSSIGSFFFFLQNRSPLSRVTPRHATSRSARRSTQEHAGARRSTQEHAKLAGPRYRRRLTLSWRRPRAS
jgi:hypothetical protein